MKPVPALTLHFFVLLMGLVWWIPAGARAVRGITA